MLPLGGQARPKGGYVTLHGLCAKLPVPAQTLTILRHITNFFARHTPHSHTHLDADITTFSLGDDASPCCFFAKPPDIAWFICHYHQTCHTLSGLAVYSESARALLLIRLRSNTSKKKKKHWKPPLRSTLVPPSIRQRVQLFLYHNFFRAKPPAAKEIPGIQED
jgi:hypothetical protein